VAASGTPSGRRKTSRRAVATSMSVECRIHY
jgi:hypothetical protein